MRNEDESLIEVDADLVHETPMAYLVRDAEGREHWIPKSQVRECRFGMDSHIAMLVPEWLAEERELV